jgi:hypothetical protein
VGRADHTRFNWPRKVHTSSDSAFKGKITSVAYHNIDYLRLRKRLKRLDDAARFVRSKCEILPPLRVSLLTGSNPSDRSVLMSPMHALCQSSGTSHEVVGSEAVIPGVDHSAGASSQGVASSNRAVDTDLP